MRGYKVLFLARDGDILNQVYTMLYPDECWEGRTEYIVSLDRAYDEESYRLLTSFGYKEKADFIYRRFKPIVIE